MNRLIDGILSTIPLAVLIACLYALSLILPNAGKV